MLVPLGKIYFRGNAGSSVRLFPLKSTGAAPALWSSMMSGKVVPFAINVLVARTSLIRRLGVLVAVKVGELVGTAATGITVSSDAKRKLPTDWVMPGRIFMQCE